MAELARLLPNTDAAADVPQRIFAYDRIARRPNWGRVIVADQSSRTEGPVVSDPAEDITPCFDPTSRIVYFTSSRSGVLQLHRVSIATLIGIDLSSDARWVY